MSKAPNDFLLLAIRPGVNCSSDYSNNLKKGEIYPFYSNYTFNKDTNGCVYEIVQNGHDHGLYTKKPLHHVNVSAVVGKNGSGKSTLLELLFLAGYLAARQNNLLKIDLRKNAGLLEEQQLKKIVSGLQLEVYFQKGPTFYCIYAAQDFQPPANTTITYYDLLSKDPTPLTELFYTIAVNYSLHGLNEDIIGKWIGRLFHKNDGYQSPVVINPYRDSGTINVNGEMHFAQIRLLANLMSNKANNGEILPGKFVTDLKFVIDREKLSRVEGHHIGLVKEALSALNKGVTAAEIFDLVYTALIGESPVKSEHSGQMNQDWEKLTVDYVIRKLVRIVVKYPAYKVTYYAEYGEDKTPGIKNVKGLISALEKDHSHITLKLRQALQFYRFDPLRLDGTQVRIENDRIHIPLKNFAERLEEITSKYEKVDLAEIIPVAPFTPRIIVDREVRFDKLSSGEQQYIHTIQAIAYHILNLNSVFKVEDPDRKKYERVNIVLDEIELYFHPEFQRRFVNDLLNYIDHLDIPNITGINILLLTHSPFILSDIPRENVLRLENGKPSKNPDRTFGGNIHEMLSNSFFMEATSGDFATAQFKQVLEWYEKVDANMENQPAELRIAYQSARPKLEYIIRETGEDVIRGILENHLEYMDERLLAGEVPQRGRRQTILAEIYRLNQQLEDLDD